MISFKIYFEGTDIEVSYLPALVVVVKLSEVCVNNQVATEAASSFARLPQTFGFGVVITCAPGAAHSGSDNEE